MSIKVNSTLAIVDNIRERVYHYSIKYFIRKWKNNARKMGKERKANAYKAFLNISLKMYHKHKKILQKKQVPRYM